MPYMCTGKWPCTETRRGNACVSRHKIDIQPLFGIVCYFLNNPWLLKTNVLNFDFLVLFLSNDFATLVGPFVLLQYYFVFLYLLRIVFNHPAVGHNDVSEHYDYREFFSCQFHYFPLSKFKIFAFHLEGLIVHIVRYSKYIKPP